MLSDPRAYAPWIKRRVCHQEVKPEEVKVDDKA
jgi:hypothetical protein